MKLKKVAVMSGITALCMVGFIPNIQASNGHVGKLMNKQMQIMDKVHSFERTMIRSEETAETTYEEVVVETAETIYEEVVEETTETTYEEVVEESTKTTYVNPCAYGHENCDGVHTASSYCAYGHENCNGNHATGNCEYYENCDGQHNNVNQGNAGMGYHHGNGTGDGYQNSGNHGNRKGNHHN